MKLMLAFLAILCSVASAGTADDANLNDRAVVSFENLRVAVEGTVVGVNKSTKQIGIRYDDKSGVGLFPEDQIWLEKGCTINNICVGQTGVVNLDGRRSTYITVIGISRNSIKRVAVLYPDVPRGKLHSVGIVSIDDLALGFR